MIIIILSRIHTFIQQLILEMMNEIKDQINKQIISDANIGNSCPSLHLKPVLFFVIYCFAYTMFEIKMCHINFEGT
jgi:hypothetical protein